MINDKLVDPKNPPFILIVDDVVKNLKLLDRTLEEQGFDVAVAQNGQEALELANADPPDLILLDIMMPNMNGYEVCKKLKSSSKLEHIPVIFLTAKNETTDIVKGFQLGGADYVTKPFDKEELLARINTQLELKFSRDLIIKQNEELSELNREKSEIMGIAAHDLKNPLSGIKGFAEMIEMSSSDEEAVLEFAAQIRNTSSFMFNLIKDLLDFNSIEQGSISLKIETLSLDTLIDSSIKSFALRAEQKDIKLINDYNNDLIKIKADPAKSKQILDNIISNALKFSKSGTSVNVRASVSEEYPEFAIIEVEDQGPGIRKREMDRLFKKFSKLSNRPTDGESSSGLGLSIVKKLIEMMDGRIWCESEYGIGSTFKILFPLAN